MDVRNVHVKTMDIERQLRDSHKSKASIDENIDRILCRISELHSKVESISHDRNITKEKLESKQGECQLLSEIRDVLTECVQGSMKEHRKLQENESAYRILLEKKIDKKMKKIEKLEEELRQKDSDLQLAQKEARSLNEELSQARADLEKKHEEVKQLQKKNEELACSYNIEKEQVSKLVQIAVTLTADKEKVEVHTLASIFCLYMSNHFVSIIIMHVYLLVATTDQYKR